MCRPPPLAAVYAPRRFFMRGGGIALRGACPSPCRLTAPLWCPQGGVSGWSAVDRAVPEAARGGVLFFSPPYPAFSFLYCPHPPSPRSQSALPLRERGRLRLFHARGFAPCIPGAEPGRHLQPQQKRYPAGGLPCLPPADHAFSLFSFPHPPDPLPLRGRGGLRFFHARGFAPCIPGAEPGRHLQPQQKRYPAGGLPCLPPADHAFSLFSFPHPPDPLPLRGRGRP